MQFTIGEKLGPYEILAPIGAGGMGEVFRARDTRLARDVAIKASNARFSERFEHEARAVAALNHPYICQLYDVGPNYLVMELVEGLTLADRIKQGPIPAEECLRLARQIAEALEAAHDKDIIHRDLKPANIKIKADGTVKVLDFGLAKLGPAAAVSTDDSPTLSMTSGVIVGTASYMSPEQARGKQVDKRSDIWAFGVVLYEMLTGRRLFKGEDVSEILAAVIKEEPNLEAVPAGMRRLLRLCLEKDPKRRLHDIADAKLLFDEAAVVEVAPKRAHRPVGWILAASAFFLIAAVALPLAVAYLREKPPAVAAVRFQIPIPDKVVLGRSGFSLSPDGHRLVFSATGADGIARLYVRTLDALESRPLPGTEGAGAFPPWWSPDSRFVGFAVGNRYLKIDVTGGPPQTLCEFSGTLGGGAWNRDGVVLVTANPGPVMQVPEAGGSPTPVTAIDHTRQELYHGRPSFLPDGRHFLYIRFSTNPEYRGVYIGSLDVKPQDQDRRRILPGPFGVSYVPSADPAFGYVLFERDGTLMAQPFDNRKLQLGGQAVPIAEQVGNNAAISAFFAVSDTGVLAFRTGGASGGLQVTEYERNGNVSRRLGDVGPYSDLALSPDGTRLASLRLDQQLDIWLYEIARGISTRFTFSPNTDRFPVWSPDGSRVAFSSNRGGHFDLYQKNANGTGDDELLLKSDQDKSLTSWSRDGRYLLFSSIDPKSGSDIWVLPMQGDHKPAPFLRTEFSEGRASFSPDGRWVAYDSNESGRNEVYIRPFSLAPGANSPSAGGKWQISKAGGTRAHWRGDNKQLYYVAADARLMAVDVTANDAFQAGIPEPLFTAVPNGDFQVAPDGKHFLIIAPPQQTAAEFPITMLLNWPALLKK